MSLAPTYEAIRCETSGKPLTREKPAEFSGTGHQCKDGYCHQFSIIFESVETFIRIVGLYLGVVPLTCVPVVSILWLFYSIIHCLMCVDTYSLNCIQFPLWTLIDSFVWNEIVHGISYDISGRYHQYDAYSTPIRWSRVTLNYLPGSVGVACSPILSVSFEGMGCEPILNLAATPDEWWGCEYNMYRCQQDYTSNFMGKADVCELYYQLVSVQKSILQVL